MTTTATKQQAPAGSRAPWFLDPGRRPRLELLGATLVYLAGALVLTWPLLPNLGDAFYMSPGRPFGDYTGVMAQMREMVEQRHIPFTPGELEDFNYPDGQPIQWALHLATLPHAIMLFGLGALFGSVAGFNLFVLLGYVLTGAATFLLVRRLTGSAALGLVFGWAFAFYPFAAANGEHPDYIHGWPLVLLVWRWIELIAVPTVRNAVLAALAAMFALAWTPYYILLGGVLFATLLSVGLIRSAVQRRLRAQAGPQLLAGGLVLVFMLGLLGLSKLGPNASGLRPNLLIDLTFNSARPQNFVVPSGHNPVTGLITEDYLTERGWHLNTEKLLYVGWSLLVLAAVALVAAVRRRLPPLFGFLALAFAASAAVAAIFSGPPQWGVGGLLIDMPSYYVFQVTEGWRIFSRFVVVVELGLVLLAALGAWHLLRGRGPRARLAILAVLAVVVPLDLWGQFSPRVFDITTPAIYSTLRELPDGVVAQYPLRDTEQSGDYRDQFFQSEHGKPMLNGYPPRGPAEARALSLHDLGDPNTVEGLREIGVTYVLLEKNPLPMAMPTNRPGEGLRRIAEDDFATLYRLESSRPNSR